MGGVKRKIPIEMIGKKDSRAVAYSKRTKGLYSKAAELCLLADAQIAILATPVSSNSNASFYTFGHSSVDNVVAAFLANERPRPREDLGLGLGFCWEDERLAKSEDPEKLRDAINSMSKMLQDLKELRSNALQNRPDCDEDVEKKGLLDGTHQNHTLNPESCCDNNALLGNVDGCNQELLLDDIDQIINFESTSSSVNSELENISMVTPNHQNSFSDHSNAIVDEELVVHTDLYDDNNIHLSNLDEDLMLQISDNNNNNSINNNVLSENFDEDLMLQISDNNNSINNNVLSENFDEFIQELDLDEIFDFKTNYVQSLEMDGVSMVTTTNQDLGLNSETVGDGGFVMMTHIDLDEDNLCFSDYFNDLTSSAQNSLQEDMYTTS